MSRQGLTRYTPPCCGGFENIEGGEKRMAIEIISHEEGWTARIQPGDSIQLYHNGSPLAATLVTVPTGNTARIYLRYHIEANP